MRTTTPAGTEHLIPHGIVDDGVLGSALDLQSNGDAKMGYAMQVITGAIERVDDPDMITVTFGATFLSEDCMIRVISFDFTYNLQFTGFVDFRDIIMPCLLGHGDAGNVVKLLTHQVSGNVGGINSDI